jgi:hypothetical protein
MYLPTSPWAPAQECEHNIFSGKTAVHAKCPPHDYLQLLCGVVVCRSAAAADAADAGGSYGWQPQAVTTKPGQEVLHAQLAAVAALAPGSHHSTLDGSSKGVGCHSTTGDPGSVFITQRAGLAGCNSHSGQGLSTEASHAGGAGR